MQCIIHCESLIKTLEEQLSTKDDTIVSLEEKLVQMSLELASTKANKDELELSYRTIRQSTIKSTSCSDDASTMKPSLDDNVNIVEEDDTPTAGYVGDITHLGNSTSVLDVDTPMMDVRTFSKSLPANGGDDEWESDRSHNLDDTSTSRGFGLGNLFNRHINTLSEEIDMSHSSRSDGLDESTSSSRWGIIFQRKKNHRDISSSDVSQSEEPHQPNTFKEAMNDTATGKGRRVRSNARQLRSLPSNRNFLSAVCFATEEEEEDLDAWCNDRSFVKELKVLQDQDRAVAQATTHQEEKNDSDSTDEDQHQDTDQSIAIQRIISRREAMKRYRASMASNGAKSWY